jgi:peptidoglycan hydrolase-like protein with peptidoglycan-binding domain
MRKGEDEMEDEAKQETGISRRNFLKFSSGLFGLTIGALSLPSLGWGETSDVTADMAEEDNRLARSHRKRTSGESKTVRQAQQQLKAAGFDPGPVDGRLGPNTRAALRDYQAAHSLPTTGKLDRATQRSLMAGA